MALWRDCHCEPVKKPSQPKRSRTTVPSATPASVGAQRGTGVRQHLALAAILLLLVLLAYANSFTAGFVLDNRAVILDDPRVRSATARNLTLILTQDYWPLLVTGVYRPLTTFSFLVNYDLLGNASRPPGYHVINYLLHAANTLLAYGVGLVLLRRLWPAFFLAALFGVHPISTEAVTNLVGRADLLATLSVLGGFLCYVRSTLAAASRRLLWLGGMMLTTTLGVFCKETAVLIVPMVVLYDLIHRLEPGAPSRRKTTTIKLWSFFACGYLALVPPLAIMWAARQMVYAKLPPPALTFGDNPLTGVDFWTSRLTAVKVLGKYLWLLVWPRSLSCDYSFNQIPFFAWHWQQWEDLKVIVVLLVIAAALAMAVWSLRRDRALSFCLLFFFVALLPTSNLIILIGSIMAERFLYLPSLAFAGAVVCVAFAVAEWLERRLRPALAGAQRWSACVPQVALSTIVLVLTVRTFVRNVDWQSDVRLWTQAATVCPNSYKPYSSLAGLAYDNQGPGGGLDRCLELGEKALAILETAPPPITHQPRVFLATLGNYYRTKGDTFARRSSDGALTPAPEGKPWYERALRLLARAESIDRISNETKRQKLAERGANLDQIPDLGYDRIYVYLGDVYLRLAEYDKARAAYQYLRHINPALAEPYLKLATLALAERKSEEACVALIQTLVLDPTQQAPWRRLVTLHQSLHPGCPASLNPADPPNLTAECPSLRALCCRALDEMVQVFQTARRPSDAEKLRGEAVGRFGCR